MIFPHFSGITEPRGNGNSMATKGRGPLVETPVEKALQLTCSQACHQSRDAPVQAQASCFGLDADALQHLHPVNSLLLLEGCKGHTHEGHKGKNAESQGFFRDFQGVFRVFSGSLRVCSACFQGVCRVFFPGKKNK